MSWTSRRQEIQAEHVSIREVMRRIESELDRLRDDPARPGDAWELPGLVGSFREHLLRHFELEESGGLLGAAADYYAPDMQRTVAALVAEHREFTRVIDRIVGELDSSQVPERTVQAGLVGDLRKFIAEMARHEAAENDLLGALLETE